MKFILIIGIIFAVFVVIVIAVGVLVITAASEEIYREFDDQDQIRFIREWKQKQDTRKRGRKPQEIEGGSK